jgi:predicted O-methyltransferase YrrM
MTSREATPMLALEWDGEIQREPSDMARLLAFGAIQWPWLLKSLYGGRKKAKAALLARLQLPSNALPNLGSWKADVGLLDRIVDHIAAERPETVVELGAGASTLIVARTLQLLGRGGRLISYDQHDAFVEATRVWLADHGLCADLKHAPITSGSGRWADLWYDLDAVPDSIDLLLIDGPPWAIGPTVRGKASRLFSRIKRGGTVMLDDAARPGERLVARRWQRDWPNFDWCFEGGIKGTLVGRRTR